ncbi:MAG TPA: PQQ-binding-like beta-propeller repeat protein [Solirubrobacteraceae bacterium]|nr:PQQ-binding-like beta-propeller repeat protein [Solirubrobacteraceae bacterium]
MDLEDRLWEQLEAAADREAARGHMARVAAATRGLLPAWKLRAAAVTVAATAAVVALVVAVSPDRATRQWDVERFGVGGTQLSSGVVGHDGLWSYDERSGQVLRLDPRTHRVIARVSMPATSSDVTLASGDDAVWAVPTTPVTHSSSARPDPAGVELNRIDPRMNRVVSELPLPSALRPVDIVALPDAMWVWGQGGAVRVDPSQKVVSPLISPRGERVMGFAATDRRVTFFTDFDQLVTFDARTGAWIATVPFNGANVGEELVPIGDSVVAYREGGVLAKIDPVTGRDLWTVRLGGRPRDMTTAGGRLWLLLAEPGMSANELRSLDAGNGHTVSRIALETDDALSLAPAGDDTPLVTTQSGELIAVAPE